MNFITKSERIRLLFEQFAKLCPNLPSSSFEIWEGTPNDPPDICVGNNDLGIEFVDFIHGADPKGGSSLRASEITFDQIVRQAQQQFETAYGLPLWVTFSWLPDTRPRKSEKEPITEAIVRQIGQLLPPNSGASISLDWENFAGTLLDNYLSRLGIMYLPEVMTKGHWSNSQAGWPGVTLDIFIPLIKQKENDLPKYADKFISKWLVIVSEGFSISMTALPDNTIFPSCLNSTFDRVYFFSSFDDYIICLT